MTAEDKKLERPRAGRMLAGVCAAIAGYFGLDVTLVRVGYVLLFTAFSGVIAYFILVIVIPQEKNRYFK